MPLIPLDGWYGPVNGYCIICQQEKTLPRNLLCDTHFQEYQLRQAEGVPADALDRRWRDTLANWRDKPTALVEEDEAKSFLFGGRLEEWLLFVRGYDPPDLVTEPRLPDWLAVHSKTDAVRRFVEVPRFEVEDDLTGYQPAPFQEDVQERWGNPASLLPPPPKYERSEEYWKHHEELALPVLKPIERLVQDALMPIYGVAGNVLGAHVDSIGSGGGYVKLSSASFTYSSLIPAKFDCTFTLETHDLPTYRREHWDESFLNFEWYPQGADVPLAEHIRRDFVIAGATLRGGILYWKQVNRSHFLLLGKEAVLSGDSRGFSLEELFQLLESLVIIKQGDDLVTQYEHEFHWRG